MSSASINFDELINCKGKLYLHNDVNRFKLGNIIFEVIEDEEDGYRSSLKDVKIVATNSNNQNAVFLADITIKADDKINGWTLVDADGHKWYTFGTDQEDEYYPCFVFEYTPFPDLSIIKKAINR